MCENTSTRRRLVVVVVVRQGKRWKMSRTGGSLRAGSVRAKRAQKERTHKLFE